MQPGARVSADSLGLRVSLSTNTTARFFFFVKQLITSLLKPQDCQLFHPRYEIREYRRLFWQAVMRDLMTPTASSAGDNNAVERVRVGFMTESVSDSNEALTWFSLLQSRHRCDDARRKCQQQWRLFGMGRARREPATTRK
jgi:hypothetical protein